MRILKIELNNINALRGEHIIDFRKEPFKTAGLFAITGATGSGKTTLLDVISLALFNRIPRHDHNLSSKFLDSTGAVITRNTREAYAAVTYACDNGTYRSLWSVHITRNNTMADYQMEIADEKSGTLLPVSKGKIPGKNEELIGLNYDQFIRAIVLAQGDFAKFLKSNKNDRNRLLEQITGTEIYRELGIMAFRNAREVENKMKELETLALNAEQKLKSAEELEVLTKSKNELEGEMNKLNNDLTQIKEQLRIYEELNSLKTKKVKQREELESVKKQFVDFENRNGKTLKINEQLMPYREDISNFSRTRSEIKMKSDELQNILEQENKLQKVEAALQKKGRVLGIESTDFEDLLQSAEAKLNAYKEAERELNRIKKEYLSKRKAIAAAVNKNPDEIPPDYKIHFDRELKAGEDQLNELNKTITRNKELPQSANELEKVKELLYTLNTERKDINQKEEMAHQLSQKLSAVHERLTQLPKEIETAENKHQKAELQLTNLSQQKELQKLRASLDEHRNRLIDGEPCPLCGAEHHPFAEGTDTGKNIDDHEIVEAKKTEKQLLTALQSLQFELNTQTTAKIEIEAERNHNSVKIKNLKEKEHSLVSRLPEDWQKLNTAELQAEFDKRKNTLSHFEKALRRVEQLKAVLPAVVDLADLNERGKTQRSKLKALHDGDDFIVQTTELIETGKQTITKVLTNQTEKKGVNTELSKLNRQLTELTDAILAPLTNLGYSTIEHAAEDMIPLGELEKIRTRKETLAKEQSSINQDIKNIQDQIEERETNCKLENAQVAEIKKEEIDSTLKSKKENLKKIEFSLSKNAENRTEAQQHRDNIQRLKTENRGVLALKSAIGDADGKKFREFAQKLTLRQLTLMANNRLQNLSERYRLDIPGQNEGDDLVIVDMDMGEARRAATTLSGGETFLVSLALALAMSDLAAKSVKIESMFIDEGFGTLDPETLDKTLDVLEKLQAADEKSVGIISHVNALKERITTQIVLSKTGRGYSEMKIAG